LRLQLVGASAVLGGLIGYLAAWRQSAVDLARIESEDERFRAELAEKELQDLRGACHDYLITAHGFHLGTTSGRMFDEDALGAWLEEFEYHTTAVQLFGAQEAKDAVRNLERVVDDVIAEAGRKRAAEGGGAIGPHLAETYPYNEQAWIDTYRGVVEAMRAHLKRPP
jgi:hypothetical protein